MKPVWSLFLTCLAAQNDLNGSKSARVGEGKYPTLLVGAFWGHFGPFLGPFWSDFWVQRKRLGPVLRLFLMRLAAQSDLNGPKSGTVGQGNYQT